MDWIDGSTFLTLMSLLVADVTAGIALVGLARAQARLGRWRKADAAYAFRLAAPLPATRWLLDGLQGQRPFLEHERLETMRLFGRTGEAAGYADQLLASPRTPAWLRILAAAQAAEALAESGHQDAALGRLEALLDEAPPEIPALRGALQSARLPLLLSEGRWDEAARALVDVEGLLPTSEHSWPVHRLAALLARDEGRKALLLVRRFLDGSLPEAEPAENELRESHGSVAIGPLLAARAAHEVGWAVLRDRLVQGLRELALLPPLAAPVLSALECVAAAEAGDEALATSARARAEAELDVVGRPGAARLAAERLLVQADSELGRHEESLSRAAAGGAAATSPLARWSAGRALGEALERAGRPGPAAEAYRGALASGIETRFRPVLERRVEELGHA